MSDMSNLTRLARFEPASPLASSDAAVRESALRTITRGLEPGKPVHRRVTDLLSVVMALSARTRRMVLPRVTVDVDVFGPDGKRALRMYWPED